MNLFLDTSSNRLVLALFNDKLTFIDYKYTITCKNMTDILISQISNILNQNHLSIEMIKKIFVVNGPGSFTGIKLNSIFANTCKSLIKEIELYCIDSCMMQNCYDKSISIIDAKSDLFYSKLIIGAKSSKIILLNKEFINRFSKKYSIKIVDNIANYDLVKCLRHNIKNFVKTERIKPNYVKNPV